MSSLFFVLPLPQFIKLLNSEFVVVGLDTWKGYRVIRFKFHFLSFNCWCKEDLQSIILNIPCSVEYGPIITMTPMSHSCCFKVTLCLRFAPYITNVSVWSTMAAEHELLEYVR